MKNAIITFLILFGAIASAQPELDIKPNRIEFEDLFNRVDFAFLINKGNQILTIDSIAYNDSIFIISYENNLHPPFTILPDDSIKMTVFLSAFYQVSLSDTADTMYVFNNGINSPKPLEVRIRFFEDEFGKINGTIRDSLTAVNNAIVYFLYDGVYLLDTAITNNSGFYSKTLPVGNYTLGVEKEGYYVVFHDSTYDPFFAEFVQVDSGSTRTIDFNLEPIVDPNLVVRGQIIDSINGVNVNKGIVIVRNGTHVPIGKANFNPIFTDTIYTFAGFIRPDGSYSVNIQVPDYYYLQAYTNNFLPGYYNDQGIASVYWQNADSCLIDGNIIDKNISLVRDSSYGGGSIGGLITFSGISDGSNYEGVTIIAKNVNNGALYSYNFGKQLGEYKVTNIPYGTYELVAQKIGIDNALSQTVTIDPVNNQITGINLNFVISGVANEVNNPSNIMLFQNYPNPFNPSTYIVFSIPFQTYVSLKIYDILGNEIETLVSEDLPEGTHSVIFDGSNFTSGVYFYKLQAGEIVNVRKMILIK